MSGSVESPIGSGSLWLAPNPSKRWGELFFLLYTPFWLTLILGIVVPYKLYETFTELEYLLVALASALPAFLIPIILIGKADASLAWKDRYWVKANLWIIVFSYVGNYFLTHYFFQVLGASYTFPSWKMNNVPHTCFFLAHVCFLFYHVASNITLRRLRHSIAHLPDSLKLCSEAAWILALSYFIAYLETVAIANFPYYEFVDRSAMYRVGCLFYAIYFIVSFPMFFRMDEISSNEWDLCRVAVDALGAAMLVPHTCFFLAHVCFLFYHVASNITLRRLRHSIAHLPDSLKLCSEAAWILALSYFIAYLETVAIANFPYYEFVDRSAMYRVGCLFYAIYFIVSFPMFFRMDEISSNEWDLCRVAVDALGAAMLVTIILDLWRVFLGPIVPLPEGQRCHQYGLPWFSR